MPMHRFYSRVSLSENALSPARLFSFVLGCALVLNSLATAATSTPVLAQNATRTFPETGQTVTGDFLTYWNEHGALAQQGYPISPEMQEVSEIDGKVYTVQYFERAKFEKHPEQSDPANRVLLELFGVQEYRDRYPQATYPQGAPNQVADTTTGSVIFQVTGKRLGGTFLAYWKSHGDVRQQGYPVSDVFEELAEDGKIYRVQYFERAKFELHPEFAGTTSEVLLSRIGAKYLDKRYVKAGNGNLTPRPKATPLPAPAPTETVKPADETVTLEVLYKGGKVTFKSERGAGRIVDKNTNENLDGVRALFDGFYDAKGYLGPMDVDVIWLSDGYFDSKVGRNHVNGGLIIHDSANTSTGRTFRWNSVDMMEGKAIEDVRKYEIFASNVGTRENTDLLKNSRSNQDGDTIDYGVGGSIVMRFSHINSGVEFGQFLRSQPELFPLLGYVNGRIDATEVPLKLLPPAESGY